MARLPTQESLGALPDVRSPRTPVARVQTSAVSAGLRDQARAVSGIGPAAQQLQAAIQKRQDDEDEYSAELAFQEFKFTNENDLVSAVDTVKPEDVSGFTQTYQERYQKNAKTFLASIPESQKQRIDGKLFTLERSLATSARDFQRKELGRQSVGNVNTLTDNASAAARSVTNSAEFGQLIQGVSDVIDRDPNLNPRQKEEILKQASRKISEAYLDARTPTERMTIIENERRRRRGKGAVKGGSVVDRIIHAESRGKVTAKNDKSSASGPGQFLDDTWMEMIKKHRPDILQGRTKEEVLALRTDKNFYNLSVEMTRRYQEDNNKFLASRGLPVRPGTTYLAHFAGPGGAARILTTDPSKPSSAVFTTAQLKANPFLKGKTVGEVITWADNKMGGAGGHETVGLGNFSDAELDVVFDGAQKQEIKLQKAEQQAQEKAEEEAREQRVDQLRSHIFDGKADADTVLEARKKGWFKDHKEFESVLDYAKEVAEGERDAAVLQDIVSGKTLYNPANKAHKKAVNDAYDRSGTNEKLVNRDEKAADSLVKLFGDLNSLPTSAAGTLSHMLRSQDKDTMVYALQTLDRMRRTSPEAFEREFSDKGLQRQVEFFTTQGQFLTGDELVSRMKQITDPIQESIRKERRITAGKLMKDVTPEKVIEDLDLDTIFEFSDPEVAPMIGVSKADVATAISREYKELFTEEYAENGGNAELAASMALRQLRTVWQRSDVTGNARIMKHPPEARLPSIEGSHEWVKADFDRDMKKAFGADRSKRSREFGPFFSASGRVPDTISLVPVPRFNVRAPAWNVVYSGANGEIQVLLNEDGTPYRQVFDAEPHKKLSQANYKRRRALALKEMSMTPLGRLGPGPTVR